jgi:magnesium transporter
MIGNLLKPELHELIERRDFNRLRDTLTGFPAADVAEILADLSPDDRAVMLRVLPHHFAADVFEHMDLEVQEQMLRALGNEQVARILNEMEPDDRTAILEELPAAATRHLLNLLSPEERSVAVTLLGYPEGSIARRMTPEYVMIESGWIVDRVLAHLRHIGQKLESFNQLFVVGKDRRLVGVVRLRNLLVSGGDVPVEELMEPQVVALHANDPQEEAVETFKKYDCTALPVIDSEGKLVGMLTVDDVLDIAEEETTEDMQKMGGMQALDASYLQTGLGRMIQKRGGWLILLFLGQMLTASAMAHFEDELATALVLALFIPLIISSGGNSGSQASTLVIRAMAVRDVELRDWFRVFRRELATGLCLGGILALIGFARIVLSPDREAVFTDHFVLLGIAVGASIAGVVVFGSLVGAMLPFFLRRLHLDPAVCSAPFVATFVDVTGIVIYFSVARLVLSGTLL